MSDLISRSEAVQRLIQETTYSKSNLIHINTVKRLLQDVDTAYDIDKVVKELEEWTFNADINVGDGTIMNHDLIVSKTQSKSSSMDVCEWIKQYKTYDWQPSCETNSVYNVAGVGWFKYCPYCGKKIKVVE